MSRVLLLAWHYVAYHKTKSAILVVCLTLTMVLPLSAHLLISMYGQKLTERARETPLVVGAKGNRFDLVLKALYFNSATVEPVYIAEVHAIRDSGLARAIPLHLEYTARDFPIVGTSLAYFDFRELEVAAGHLPQRLGQAVVGANVAATLGLSPGDHLFSDQKSLYDITRTYPLKMHVVGVLEKRDTPDDDAVFVDVKTAYIIAGISHGHQDVTTRPDPSVVLAQKDGEVVTNASIVEYNEVTPGNIDSFHTHAPPEELPISAIVVLPHDAKSSTIIKARYQAPGRSTRMLVPADVVDELLGLVFRVKRFFDASFGLVLVSTGLFLLLVVLLSLRLRKREMETMRKLGCSRLMAMWLQVAELGIVLMISVVLAGFSSWAIVAAAPRFIRLL